VELFYKLLISYLTVFFCLGQCWRKAEWTAVQ